MMCCGAISKLGWTRQTARASQSSTGVERHFNSFAQIPVNDHLRDEHDPITMADEGILGAGAKLKTRHQGQTDAKLLSVQRSYFDVRTQITEAITP